MQTTHQNTALLVMDMQDGILGGFPGAEPLINNVAKAIAAARAHQIPVIYVVVGFRQGLPEISPDNKSFGAARQRFEGADMTEFMKVHSALAPQEGEVVVSKRRVSAYAGSD